MLTTEIVYQIMCCRCQLVSVHTSRVVVSVGTGEGDQLVGGGLLAATARNVDLSALGVKLLSSTDE